MAATREGRGKRLLLDSSWAVKLFVRLTELSWSNVREQSPIFTRAKKAQKITEYCDTAPLTKVSMASIHLYFAGKQVGDTQKRGKPEMRSSCRKSLDLH